MLRWNLCADPAVNRLKPKYVLTIWIFFSLVGVWRKTCVGSQLFLDGLRHYRYQQKRGWLWFAEKIKQFQVQSKVGRAETEGNVCLGMRKTWKKVGLGYENCRRHPIAWGSQWWMQDGYGALYHHEGAVENTMWVSARCWHDGDVLGFPNPSSSSPYSWWRATHRYQTNFLVKITFAQVKYEWPY